MMLSQQFHTKKDFSSLPILKALMEKKSLRNSQIPGLLNGNINQLLLKTSEQPLKLTLTLCGQALRLKTLLKRLIGLNGLKEQDSLQSLLTLTQQKSS
jgi:hypothetical protein